MVASTLHLDPVVVMEETSEDRLAVRDAAAQVIWDEERKAHERAKQNN